MGEPITLLEVTCSKCVWPSGDSRAWFSTYDAFVRWPRCPFCGAGKPKVVVVHGPEPES